MSNFAFQAPTFIEWEGLALAWASGKARHEAFEPPDLSTVLAHLTYLQEILRLPEINIVFWTLTYEVQFCLVLCFAFYLKTLGRRRGIAMSGKLIFVALFIIAIFGAAGRTVMLAAGIFAHLWDAFFLGALAYWSLRRPQVRPAFATLLVLVIIPSGRHDALFGLFSAATAFALFAAGVTGWLHRGLNWRWLQGLGLISYSLYLLHNPVTGAAGFIARKAVGNGLLGNLAGLVLIIATSVIAAAAHFYAVERPTHSLSRRVRLH